MELNHFNDQIDRLKSVYGDKMYPNERTLLIWEKMNWLENHEFTVVIGYLIVSCPYAPLLDKFENAAKRFESKREMARLEDIKRLKLLQEHCYRCGQTGHIHAIDRLLTLETERLHTVIFRCVCPLAEKIGNRWPIWTEEHSKRYTPDIFGHEDPREATPAEKKILAPYLNPHKNPFGDENRAREIEESKRRAANDNIDGDTSFEFYFEP